MNKQTHKRPWENGGRADLSDSGIAKAKTVTRFVIVMFALACFSGSPHAATVAFTFMTDPGLVNVAIGPDGVWDTVDDAATASNLSGALSFTFQPVDPVTGSWEVTLPSSAPGIGSIDAYTITQESGPTTSLNLTQTRTITFADAHHFESSLTLTNGIDNFVSTSQGGFAIYNVAGRDDPSIFFGELGGIVTPNFNFMLSILPADWTAATLEYLWCASCGIPWPNQGTAVFSYTTDPAAQAPVPIAGAIWLFGSGLVAVVGIGRKRTTFRQRVESASVPVVGSHKDSGGRHSGAGVALFAAVQ